MAAGFCGLFVAIEFRERVADAGVDVGELCAAAFGAEGFVDLFGGFAEREALREIFARVCDVGKVYKRVGAFCTGCVLCFVPEFFFLWVGVVAVVRIVWVVVRGGNTWLLLLLLLLVLLGGARIAAPPKTDFWGKAELTLGVRQNAGLVSCIPGSACWVGFVGLTRQNRLPF